MYTATGAFNEAVLKIGTLVPILITTVEVVSAVIAVVPHRQGRKGWLDATRQAEVSHNTVIISPMINNVWVFLLL